mgnify:CR=1 FL=1
MGELIKEYSLQLVNISCLPSSTLFNGLVTLEEDISEVLPYLNAVMGIGHYVHADRVFDFMKDRHIVTLRPHEMRVRGLRDEDHGSEVVDELCEMLNDIWRRRASIEPKLETAHRLSPLEVLRKLPLTNCGECGEPTCLALATMVSKTGDETLLRKCPSLSTHTD